MAWEVEFTDAFHRWWVSLSENEQDDVAVSVRRVVEFGRALPFPHSSKLVTSRYSQLRELRTQSSGRLRRS